MYALADGFVIALQCIMHAPPMECGEEEIKCAPWRRMEWYMARGYILSRLGAALCADEEAEGC